MSVTAFVKFDFAATNTEEMDKSRKASSIQRDDDAPSDQHGFLPSISEENAWKSEAINAKRLIDPADPANQGRNVKLFFKNAVYDYYFIRGKLDTNNGKPVLRHLNHRQVEEIEEIQPGAFVELIP